MVTRDDSMWIALHDRMDEHPKIEPLSDSAFRAFVSLLFYCHRQNNDGVVPLARWKSTGTPKVRGELTATQPGQKNPLAYIHSDGVEIHDYLDWQQAAADVAEAKQKQSEGGALGNHMRWHVGKGRYEPKCRHCRSVGQSGEGSVPRSVTPIGGRSHG